MDGSFPRGPEFPINQLAVLWKLPGKKKKNKQTNTNMLQKLNAKNRRKEKINYKRKSVDS